MRLTKNQENILGYLKDCKDYVSPTEIGNNVGSRNSRGILRHSSWASPILKSLLKKGLIERNNQGWYRALSGVIKR